MPNTSLMTAGEVWAHRDRMEADSASLLGHMLLGPSRIEVNLGLALVWVNDGKQLQELTPKVAALNLSEKLSRLEKEVAAKDPLGSKRRTAYDAWIERMHKVRFKRNQMVHGRWSVDAHRNVIIVVLGLPTGSRRLSSAPLQNSLL